jgi:YVTN family beta-propeller protein
MPVVAAGALVSAAALGNHYILCDDPGGCTAPTLMAYIMDANSGQLAVVDTVSERVVELINVGLPNTCGVAVNAAGTRVYVGEAQNIAVIDTSGNTVVARAPHGGPVIGNVFNAGVAVNPTDAQVYVSKGWWNGIDILDTATHTVAGIVGGNFQTPYMAVTPDGRNLYVSDVYSDQVSVLDTATWGLLARIDIDNPYTVPPTVAGDFSAAPTSIAFDPRGTRAYVSTAWLSDQAGGDVHLVVIDTSTRQIITRVPTGPGSSRYIVAHPDGTRLYLSNGSVLDTTTGAIVATIPEATSGLTIDSSGTRVFLVQESPPALVVVDTKTNLPVTSIPLPGAPCALGQFVGRTQGGARP